MSIVRCQNVDKIYQQGKIEVKAINNVNLEIPTGEFMALAGPSGSGKTTLLNLIGALDRVSEGNIFIEGNDLESLNEAKRSQLRLHKIGFVFQAYNLIPVLTAIENVEFVMMLQGRNAIERRERAIKILKEVGLEKEMNRRPAEMSGGQQQRVAVARALVTEPAIILADEPTANLDSKTGENLLEMMRELNEKRKTTFIFSTHDPMVMKIARRIVNLHDGGIVDDQTNS